ncbi:putative Gnk2-like domain-containing protein [Helianthus debilis subsp. tardiflorus]
MDLIIILLSISSIYISLPSIPAHPQQTMSILHEKLLFWFSLIYICLTITTTLAQSKLVYKCCKNTENYTINSAYQRNLYTALSTLSTTNSGLGFFNFSAGQGNNTAYSIALCRGDVNPDECSRCLNDSIVNLQKLCPNQQEAMAFYHKCLLQYSNNALLVYPQKKKYFFSV